MKKALKITGIVVAISAVVAGAVAVLYHLDQESGHSRFICVNND